MSQPADRPDPAEVRQKSPAPDAPTEFALDVHESWSFKMIYGERVPPPSLDLGMDLTGKSLSDLRLVRNELFARRGYLFKSAILRGHFSQFDWYQPVWWEGDDVWDSIEPGAVHVELPEEEKRFVGKVRKLERARLGRNYVETDGRVAANVGNIVNLMQFKSVPDRLLDHLPDSGFALVEGRLDQLFWVYDHNRYQAIPSFVTTDLFLQLIHVHFTNMLRTMEEEKLLPLFAQTVRGFYDEALEISRTAPEGTLLREAAAFNVVFYAVAANLLAENPVGVPAPHAEVYAAEFARASGRSGRGSPFLDYELFDYTQLQPRGHYSRSDRLGAYFAGVKWLATAPFPIHTDAGLAAAVVSARILARAKELPGDSLSDNYDSLDGVIGYLAGEVDNLSTIHLARLLEEEFPQAPLGDLMAPAALATLRARLVSMDPQRMHPQGATPLAAEIFARPRLFFTPARYTFDGEILQNLVHVLKPEPLRPFPKGLDIFSVMGSEEATRILLGEYREQNSWPAYPDSLIALTGRLGDLDWDANSYRKRMELLFGLKHTEAAFPYFMHSAAWQRKSLSTALAAWTELRHEMLLYIKQPVGAEGGEGGAIPPPVIPGYVVPHVDFWDACIDLLQLSAERLAQYGVTTAQSESVNGRMIELAQFLLAVSEKEIAGQRLTDEEFDRIARIGGEAEHLTLAILGQQYFHGTADEKLPITTDVYTFNTVALQEAVGQGDEIYVVVEIGGLLYLTRGAVFSYYEFHHPTDQRLTDEAWQSRLEQADAPERPEWLRDLFVPIESLKSKPHFGCCSAPSSVRGSAPIGAG